MIEFFGGTFFPSSEKEIIAIASSISLPTAYESARGEGGGTRGGRLKKRRKDRRKEVQGGERKEAMDIVGR